MDLVNKISFAYDNIEEAFPPCDPGVEPFGSRLLVQIRTPKRKTAGGIVLVTGGDAQETEFWSSQVALVRSVGPLAFRNRTTMEPWPEGSWCQTGDFVRVPKFGGDRWTVKIDDEIDALIVVFNDLDIIGKITGDPTKLKTYI